jgi:hypothetical protein
MIKDLDESLAALLQSELREEFSEQVQISFAAPDDQFPPQSVTLPAIDLFLYDVRENLDLRNSEAYVERSGDGTAVSMPAPVRVDASYLITAWPSPNVTNPSEDEHRLLGEVMRSLLRYRTLPPEMLRGELTMQDLPLPVSTLQSGRLQSLGEFWQALGGKPKAALNYTVTLSINVAKPHAVPLVIDKVIKIRMETGGGL